MEINELPINSTPTSGLYVELSDGQRAMLASLPASSALDTHIADTAPHGATSANTASRIVTRNAGGTFTISGIQLDTAAAPTSVTGLIRWSDVDKCAEIVTEGGVVIQLGQEETVYVRNASGVALAEGDAVYITGSTGQRTTVAKVQANSSNAQKTIGLVTTSAGIANNGFGFVTLSGLVRDLNTSAYTEGDELWLSPTVAGGLTATQPTADTHRVVRIGYVVRSHVNQGMIMVATHYHGTVLANGLMEAEGAAAARTVLGISAANTPNTPSGNIAATTVQAALNELDSEKTTAAAALAAADAADLSATAALIEREGLRFDGTAGAVIGNGGIPVLGTGDFTFIALVRYTNFAGYARIWGYGSNVGGFDSFIYTYNVDGTIGCLGVSTSPAALANGEIALIACTRLAGVVSIYKNGVLLVSGSDTTNMSSVVLNLGTSNVSPVPWNGSITHASSFNYALTAAEIAALTRRGLVTLPEQRGGSMVALNTSAFVNFGGPGSVTTSTSTSATVAGAGGNYGSGTITAPKNRRFLITFTVLATGGNLAVALVAAGGFSQLGVPRNTTGTFSEVITSDGLYNYSAIGVSTASTAQWSNFSAIPLGTLFEQDTGQRNAGYMVRDTSGNNADLILPATGVSIIDPAMRGMIRFTTTTSGNQQIGGSQVIIPTNARITSWVINSSSTPSVSLGNVSGGTQFRTSSALVSGDNDITPTTRFCTTGNLWCGSNSTATLKHTIQWEYIQ